MAASFMPFPLPSAFIAGKPAYMPNSARLVPSQMHTSLPLFPKHAGRLSGIPAAALPAAYVHLAGGPAICRPFSAIPSDGRLLLLHYPLVFLLHP